MWGLWPRSSPHQASKKQLNPLATQPSQLPNSISSKLQVWEQELEHDPDSEFLIHGIKNGFDICDPESDPSPVETDNYSSATNVDTRDKVEEQIRSEIANGNYITVDYKPTIISALGAIPKPGSNDIRLIHDCSQPPGASVNDYAELEYKIKYQSISDAAEMVRPNYFAAKVDLKAAYRSVPISPQCYKFAGLKWKFKGDSHFTYLVDRKLMFGSRLAPMIFHRLSQSVQRMLRRRGINCSVVYLDDFIIIAPTAEECMAAMNILIGLLRNLGFAISWSKVCGPTQNITFLGINIDTVRMLLSLPQEKVEDFMLLLNKFTGMKRASKKQLQSLAGGLNWASSIVAGGRVYLRRILDTIQKLRAQNHKTLLSQEFHLDLQWWLTYLPLFNGRAIVPQHRQTHVVTMDACVMGSGYFWDGRWGYVHYPTDFPQSQDLHINIKEVMSAVFAAREWAPLWSGTCVIFGTDNITARSALRSKTSKNPIIMSAIRELFALSIVYDFDFDAFYIPGVHNSLADAISRIHQPGQLHLLEGLLPQWHYPPSVLYPLSDHMSFNAFLVSIFPQFPP